MAVYSDPDAGSDHVTLADHAFALGGSSATESYLNVDRILEAAHRCGAEAVHPGYGFLSENAAFAAACEAAGLVFLGPTPDQISAFGLKNTARDIAVACGAPILPGTGLLPGVEAALTHADEIGYPVMLKSAGGGGGIGMRRCNDPAELQNAYESVRRLSETHFKGSGIFLEKLITNARHIEVQTFGDGTGTVVALGERDCSVQRRNQKIVEETPAPGLSKGVRAALHESALRVMRSVRYRSAGTVEYLFDKDTNRFYFLEVNSRLQVEHGVTEEVWGVDLVEWMVRLGARELLPLSTWTGLPSGHSIQTRLYAEDPLQQFQPSSGVITQFTRPANARCDTWIRSGTEVTPFYDPLLAKIIVRGTDRVDALRRLSEALKETKLYGIATNLEFLRAIAASDAFAAAEVTTAFLNTFSFARAAVQVLRPGVMTTVQSYPGRTGLWAVGVPPSGPMDALSFRLGNRLLGNKADAAGLECTLAGPKLRFLSDTAVVLTGADMQARLDDKPVATFARLDIKAGSVLDLQNVHGPGARAYISFAGGLDVASYLGSAATFTLGRFGGHAGRALQAGDTLGLFTGTAQPPTAHVSQPALTHRWELGVLYGPHGAPDYFTPGDVDTFFAVDWQVHHNSSRTGVRLVGPKPNWARQDGGDAGLHPSNIHDNAYAIGAVDFTGDMPVLLGPDGPSLGGFVCPAVVVQAELWKLGQLAPGDTVRFRPLTIEEARRLEHAQEKLVADLTQPPPQFTATTTDQPPILRKWPDAICRASGDRYLLVEFGHPVLDLKLRLRAHALSIALAAQEIEGILDLTPGIRSLQIHYDSLALERENVLNLVDRTLRSLPEADAISVPSRIVHLPLSWDDPATRLAIERYMSSVRPDAPWCPSNLEFIRRVNGLDSIADVHRIVFDASYFVLGLGDVYLGAPVATPLDPRHRLVTTKYNPARTWTPENAVGIGGAYLCVYGMEGPGGYQFVGRTLQMWNTYRQTAHFTEGKPWLLRFFDQLRFYPVSADELLHIRREFPLGRYDIKTEQSEFRFDEYARFLHSIETEAGEFRARQQQAFGEERSRWAERGEFLDPAEADTAPNARAEVPPGCAVLTAPTTASVWRVETENGRVVASGDRVFVLEAMKMEIAVHAPEAAEIVEVLCESGKLVSAGQPLLVYRAL